MIRKLKKIIPFEEQKKKFKDFCLVSVFEKFNYYLFKYSKVRKNSVLIIEANYDSHAEVIPYFIKYFQDSGFNVDVIISPWLNHLKCLDKLKGFNKYVFYAVDNKRFLNKPKIAKYKYILFTSEVIYLPTGMFSMSYLFPNLKKYKDKLYKVQHHLDRGFDDHTIALSKVKTLENKLTVANAHYFGNVKITNKNKNKTQFIYVGALEKDRRDSDVLINAVQKLSDSGITDFHITHIGRESVDIPPNLSEYFTFLGYTDTQTLIKEMEKADFYLPLLNPEIETHSRYINAGTSGAFQLIYGFLKPCIIHKTFAEVYNMENCSIVYEKNDDLADSMKIAINMKQENYLNLQNSLKILVKSIEEESEQNLNNIFIRKTSDEK